MKIDDFYFPEKIYDKLTEFLEYDKDPRLVREALVYKAHLVTYFQHQIKICPAWNMVLGKLDKDDKEFKDMRFLARQPADRGIGHKPNMRYEQYDISKELLEDQYNKMLDEDKAIIALHPVHNDFCVLFQADTALGKKTFKYIKWSKQKISITDIFDAEDFDKVIEFANNKIITFQHLFALKDIGRYLRPWGIDIPYLDEFHDKI